MQVCELASEDGAGGAHQRDRRGLRRPARVRPRGRGRGQRPGDGRVGPPGGGRARSRRRCATPPDPPGRSDAGRLDGPVARRASKWSARRWREAACGLLGKLLRDEHELVTLIEGEGRRRRRHPAGHRVARRAPPRPGGRGPPRRPAAVPVPDQHRVSDRARRLQRLAEIPVREVHAGGDKRAEALGGLGITTRPRPDHPLPAPLHRPHAPGRRGRHGRRRGVARPGRGASRCRSRRTRQGRALVELDVDDGTGRCGSPSSTSRGAPSSSRRGPRRCSSGSSTPTGASASSPTRSSTWWATARAGSSPSTRRRRSRASPDGSSASGSPRRCGGRATARRSRSPSAGATSSTSSTGPTAFRGHPRARVVRRAATGPGAGSPSTSCCGCSSRW